MNQQTSYQPAVREAIWELCPHRWGDTHFPISWDQSPYRECWYCGVRWRQNEVEPPTGYRNHPDLPEEALL